MSPTDFGFAKLISMHDESFFANFAVFNVQPRFTVVLPQKKIFATIENNYLFPLIHLHLELQVMARFFAIQIFHGQFVA